MRLKLLLGVVALTVVLVSASAFAQNLVTNGSFETGYWTGWTTGGNFADTEVVSSPFDGYEPEDGNYFALLGPVGSPGTLSQTFSDQAGAQYTFSFYLAATGDHPSFFSAMWDGTTLLSLTDPASSTTSGSSTLSRRSERATTASASASRMIRAIWLWITSWCRRTAAALGPPPNRVASSCWDQVCWRWEE